MATITTELELRWNWRISSDEGPLKYWFRVEGQCSYPTPTDDIVGGCEVIALEIPESSNPENPAVCGKVKYIQNILAADVSEVCDKLSAEGMRWQIASIQKFSRPAENEFVTDQDCNSLEEMEYCTIPNCLKYCLETNEEVISMGMYTWVIDYFFEHTASGGITLGGTAGALAESDNWEFDSSGGIILSGDAGTYETDLDEFIYTASGSIVMSGEASFDSTWYGVHIVEIGSSQEMDFLEVNFTDEQQNDLVLPSENVFTCESSCQLPLYLEATHNMQKFNVFDNFLNRNGFSLDHNLKFYYNKSGNNWQYNSHLTGYGSDGSSQESWNIVLEWACNNEVVVGRYMYKFSLLIKQKNLNDNSDYTTRLLLTFDPYNICAATEFLFGFDFNPNSNFVTNTLSVDVETILLYDGIGVFKSSYWLNNNFNIMLSALGFPFDVERKNLSVILG